VSLVKDKTTIARFYVKIPRTTDGLSAVHCNHYITGKTYYQVSFDRIGTMGSNMTKFNTASDLIEIFNTRKAEVSKLIKEADTHLKILENIGAVNGL
jgi:hypothetical protein